jgi:heptosyltransferase-2
MEVCKQIAVEPKFNLAGRLSMMQFAALASQATLLISGDSAPAHVATAMLINQIVIFGSTSPWFGFMPPTDKARFVEVKLWCRPCTSHGRRMCPLFNKKTCLERIVPLRVAQVAEELLDCGR